MKHIFWRSVAAVAMLTATPALMPTAAQADPTFSPFGQQAVDQNAFVAIAAPYGEEKDRYQLLIIEQKSAERACWSEAGEAPTQIDPLLLNFDFSGVCGRSTDSNGYSIRIDGRDYGLDYLLVLVPRNGELFLIGSPRVDPNADEIVVGRTRGMSEGYMKIFLEPGWEFAKRTYEDRVLGHVYLTAEATDLTSLPAENASSEAPAETTIDRLINF